MPLSRGKSPVTQHRSFKESGVATLKAVQNGAPFSRTIEARTPNQAAFLHALHHFDLTYGIGPAAVGKTFLAVAAAVEELKKETVDRIILIRPAIEAGEELGFLPGDETEKVAPYMRPFYDALNALMDPNTVRSHMETGIIEIAPIAFMRGRTLSNAFVVIDEAQNCKYKQLKMLQTRLGQGSRMVITGDPDQSDLLDGEFGLVMMVEDMRSIEGISVVNFTAEDAIPNRNALVAKMLPKFRSPQGLVPRG